MRVKQLRGGRGQELKDKVRHEERIRMRGRMRGKDGERGSVRWWGGLEKKKTQGVKWKIETCFIGQLTWLEAGRQPWEKRSERMNEKKICGKHQSRID